MPTDGRSYGDSPPIPNDLRPRKNDNAADRREEVQRSAALSSLTERERREESTLGRATGGASRGWGLAWRQGGGGGAGRLRGVVRSARVVGVGATRVARAAPVGGIVDGVVRRSAVDGVVVGGADRPERREVCRDASVFTCQSPASGSRRRLEAPGGMTCPLGHTTRGVETPRMIRAAEAEVGRRGSTRRPFCAVLFLSRTREQLQRSCQPVIAPAPTSKTAISAQIYTIL